MPRLADALSRPRLLHPVAWWIWGITLAAAASRTTNPFYLLLIGAAVGLVVLQRKEVGASSALGVFLTIAGVAIGIRVVMTVLLGNGVVGSTVLVTLPEVPLPDWLAGVRLGGPVSLEALLLAVYHGMQLATILVCVGACNVLADPRRLLRYVPATLYDVGTAIVVALTYVPRLADEARQVRSARRLRGHSGRGVREMSRLAVPVLESSLERSLELAASMESRGYGRVTLAPGTRRRATTLTVIGLSGVVVGLYGLLDGAAPAIIGLPTLLVGTALAVAALMTGARKDRRTPYRRDRWNLPEWLVVGCAVPAAAVLVVLSAQGDPSVSPQQSPAVLPEIAPAAVVALLLATAAGVLAPRTPRRAELEDLVAERRESQAVAT